MPRGQVEQLAAENLGVGMEGQTLNCIQGLKKDVDLCLSSAKDVSKLCLLTKI